MSSKTQVYAKEELLAIRDSMRTLGGKSSAAAATIPKHLYVVSNTHSSELQEKDLSRDALFGAAGGKPRRSSGSGHHGQQQQQHNAPSAGPAPTAPSPSSAVPSMWVYRTKDSGGGGSHPLSNALSLEAIQNLFLDGLVEADEVELRRVDGGPFMSFKEAQQQRAIGASPSDSSSSPTSSAASTAPPPSNVWRRHSNSSLTAGAAPSSSSAHQRTTKSSEPHFAASSSSGGGQRLPLKSSSAISRDDMPSAEELAHLQPAASVPPIDREAPEFGAAVPLPVNHGPSAGLPCPIASIDEGPEEVIAPAPAHPVAVASPNASSGRQQRPAPVAAVAPLPLSVNDSAPPASSAWGKVEPPPTVDISQLLVEEKKRPNPQLPTYGWAGNVRHEPEAILPDRPTEAVRHPPHQGYANSFPSLDELAGSGSSAKSPLASSGSQRGPNRPSSGTGKAPMPQHQQTTSRKGKNVAQQFFH